MTNKTEYELATYSGGEPIVKHLAIQHSDCIILNIDLIRYDGYRKSSTYFTHFWAETDL